MTPTPPPRLTAATAQTIVETIHADTGHNINIMDAEGVIIASSDPTRLGHIHPAAVQALANHAPVEVAADTPTERTGVNLPVQWKGEWIAVVGISGPVAVVRPLAQIVRTAVTILIDQQLAHADELDHRAAAQSLIHDSPPYPRPLATLLARHGIDLKAPTVVLHWPDQPPERHPQIGAFWLDEFLAVCTTAAAANFQRHHPLPSSSGRLLISEPAHDVSSNVADIQRATHILQRLPLPGPIIRVANLAGLAILSEGKLSPRAEILHQHPTLAQTLSAFYAHDMALAPTANALHVHRNTLLYRLERVREITGLDPRSTCGITTLCPVILSADTLAFGTRDG